MSGVFADTAFYVAVVSPRDALHGAAREFASSFQGRIVTTEFVLLEVANFFNHVGQRSAFVDLMRDLRSASAGDIVPASSELFERGFDLYSSRPDKEWSLTDCTSFVVMNDFGLTDALAADRHFGQAGFRALLQARA
jgi:predicted nucleic acid-binding protein